MPDDPTNTIATTGITSVGLFALLVGLTRWIGGNFAKQVSDLNTSIAVMKSENKIEMDILKKAREDCEQKHDNAREALAETKIELASLKGRMSAIEGKSIFEVKEGQSGLRDKS